MTLAKLIYRGAGIYGLLVITPLFFLERAIGDSAPPAITHPEYYYGFVVAAFAWQFAFLLISRDPARYRAVMPITWIEKLYGAFAVALYGLGRIPTQALALGAIDLILCALFVFAYVKSRPR
jgi:hypothetical protein